MRASLRATSYAGRANEMNSHSLHGAGQLTFPPLLYKEEQLRIKKDKKKNYTPIQIETTNNKKR